MRLTLRTLLAYLDDVLDPADKDELSQKIESSEFAEDLVHRTRDTMRRLRLSAPQVLGTGMGLDPNSVAEYLDNVLPPDQVGDFERICLESDVHLAEAAACHHVLTMVLGEPADVEPRARQRMYEIPGEARERKKVRLEPAHPGASVGRSSGPISAASATVPISREPTTTIEIPEYLRTRSRWQSRGALAALAAAVLVGTALYLGSGLTGWFGRPAADHTPIAAQPDALQPSTDAPPVEVPATEQTGAPTQSDRQVAEAAPPAALGPPPPPATPGITSPALTASADASSAASSPYDVGESDRYAATAVPEPIIPPQDAAPSDPEATQESPLAATDAPIGAPSETDRYALPPTETTAAIPPQEIPPQDLDLEAPPLPPQTESSPDDDLAISDRVAMREDVPPDAADAVDAAESVSDATIPVENTDNVPTGPRELGTYLGGATVLLRHDDANGAWYRIQPRDGIVSGELLVALPEFQPQITLASGLLLDIMGGTQLIVRSGDEMPADEIPAAGAELPAVEVVYGRIVLINASMTDSDVRLKVGATIADARLARNATLAIDVQREHVPGNDPRKTPSQVQVTLYVPDGGVTWKDAAGERTAEGPARWTISDGAVLEAAADTSPPDWIGTQPGTQTSEQRFGAPVVEAALVSNQLVDSQLLELFQASSARREVKSLVTRASIHVGLFEPFVDALRDSEQRANWKSHIEALRAAMAISPESAERVWRALVAQRGERAAADLYEMLCGYNAEQIGQTPEERKMGALSRLIDWLENDSLDYRVLAVNDLAEITGKRLMSNPAAGPVERSQSVRRWRSRLEADELRPVTAE